jgi:hypothetical protein
MTASQAMSAQDYPNKPVRMIDPFGIAHYGHV